MKQHSRLWWSVRALVVTLGILTPSLVALPPASAGVGFGVVPTFPALVTVGQTGLPVSLNITNNSTTPENVGNVTLSNITLVPTCGAFIVGSDCPLANADPGVFLLSSTGVGEAGTACAGTTFTITNIDPAQDKYQFTPSTPVVLAPPGSPGGADTCRIDFTFSVLKAPTKDAQGGQGIQTAQLGAAIGAHPDGTVGSGTGTSFTTVNKAQPAISTTATATAPVGSPITDTATFTAAAAPAPAPTGTITFNLFGPANATCTGLPVFTSTVPVNGGGSYPSAPFTPTTPGTYNWTASYSGDLNNNSVVSACGAQGETTTVTLATPAIVTTAAGPVTVGGPISDSATLSGGFSPTGTITFSAFGPANATCTGTAAFTSIKTVAGNGVYPSDPFTPTLAGTYNWVASYSGDANNNPVVSACGAQNETSTVNKATPAIVTTASAPVQVGGTISDSATLSGGVAPTGTITFTLFGPANPTCTGTPIFTSTKTVAGNGVYPSDPFTTAAAGTYQFVAVYSGDANNAGATSPCGAPNESVVVAKATPAIVTTASPSVKAGSPISDSATLSAGVAPTGTITFTLFGPANPTCTGTPIFTSTKTVAGNGVYASDPFTTSVVGTYQFVAVYSGDANNVGATSPCGAPNESVVVTPATPAILTVASGSVPVGGTITDTATLSGGAAPTGTITFTVFGPANATCTGTAIFTSTKAVAGAGNYTSDPFTVAAAGTYNFVAVYSGDANNATVTSPCGAANESVVVTPVTPAITTTASPSVPAGGTISDTATLSGGVAPTGTITFTLFGPANPTCTGTPIFTSTKTVAGNGNYTSSSFTTTGAGTFNWVAVYSGDANNVTVTSPCGAPNESVLVTPAIPTIVTTASAPVAAGGTISDSAVLAGGVNPTGTITFNSYGPADATCTGTPVFTAVRSVAGNGTYTSGTFSTTAAGVYNFTASYSGDANNAAAVSGCGAVGESVPVSPATPAITTTASPSVPAGGMIFDTATLSGGANPTGTITFTLFGPANAACAGTPTFTTTKAVAGNGSYVSAPFTTTSMGTYNWVAVYSGDANNAPATSPCAAAGESVIVTPAAPVITTTASAGVTVGGAISDVATLTGGTAPTGTIVFSLFGPANPTCTGTPIFTSTKPVNGNGSYPSASFTTVAAGTYNWVAVYSGDANNGTVTSPCGAANEAVVVATAIPAIVTTASASVPAGGTIADTATLSGGLSPTGTITFTLFAPGNPSCAGTPVLTSVKTVAGNGNYTSDPFTTTAVGTYKFVAVYNGDANNAPATSACGAPGESVVVSPALPAIVTTASATVAAGGTISDTATLSGGISPGGIITFNVFGPANPTCTGSPAFTSMKSVNGNGNYTSSLFTVTAVGTYNFTASYSGDANNLPAASPCGATNESVAVTPALPAISTAASPAVMAGGTVTDTATLSGGVNPGGHITFTLFGPASPTCTGNPLMTSIVVVSGNGNYTSTPPYTTTVVGTYNWVAVYSGDNNNAGAASGCGSLGESVVVSQAAPAITTKASAPVTVGGPITDVATLTGGSSLTGTIVFTLFGPASPTCTGNPLMTSTITVNGPGDYTSLPFTTTTSGTYHWVAVYGGDLNNAGATSSCGAANEQVTVGNVPAPAISVTKVADPLSRPAPGGLFTFTVTVTNPSTVEPVKITTLVDDIYGDLATRTGSTCGTLIGVTLAPQETSKPCSFSGPFTGNSGDRQTDTVTVTGVDQHGTTVIASAKATVTLTPAPTPVALVVDTPATPLPRTGAPTSLLVLIALSLLDVGAMLHLLGRRRIA